LSIKRDLKRKDLNIWYNNIDLIVCASKSEGGPMLLLEAGAAGVPVIMTNVGLAREVIQHNKNGMIIGHNSSSELRDAILLLKNKPGRRASFARNLNKEIVKNWTYKARSHEIRSILRKLCG